jgi:hypothetical protein
MQRSSTQSLQEVSFSGQETNIFHDADGKSRTGKALSLSVLNESIHESITRSIISLSNLPSGT